MGYFGTASTVGPVHVLMMSTEHDWTKGSDQYKFIEADLSSVNRTVTPWVILTGHRMMYTTQMCEDEDYKVSLNMRSELEDLIYNYIANLMLVGHQHNYERSCQVYQKRVHYGWERALHSVVRQRWCIVGIMWIF